MRYNQSSGQWHRIAITATARFQTGQISRVVRQTLSDLVFTLSDGAAILSCLMFDKYSAGCTSGENKCVKNTMVSGLRGVESMQDKLTSLWTVFSNVLVS